MTITTELPTIDSVNITINAIVISRLSIVFRNSHFTIFSSTIVDEILTKYEDEIVAVVDEKVEANDIIVTVL